MVAWFWLRHIHILYRKCKLRFTSTNLCFFFFSEVRGQWADHESHDFASSMKSEIIAEEEVEEQMLRLCKFCQFPNHTLYEVTETFMVEPLCENNTSSRQQKILITHSLTYTRSCIQCISHYVGRISLLPVCVGKESLSQFTTTLSAHNVSYHIVGKWVKPFVCDWNALINLQFWNARVIAAFLHQPIALVKA